MPGEALLRPGGVRWTLCATDRCFKSALLSPFFRAAKVRVLGGCDGCWSAEAVLPPWQATPNQAFDTHTHVSLAPLPHPQVLPVERGAGLDQFGMRLARQRLAAGEWVHIFPEGTRSRGGRMLPVRKGVGWLVAAAAAQGAPPPLVLPFVHSGMERVLPKGASLPKLGA